MAGTMPKIGQDNKQKIFDIDEENKIVEYLISCSKTFYGLSVKKIKIQAYYHAIQLNKKIPKSWTINKMAGEEWFSSFMRRNPRLSLRSPEATSLVRDEYWINMN
ncbi:uncharacterized protein LOC135927630 [Gordionus sp. m RMFG-2023]|uniref:uncharacterized protein LOC135927630 n=1 Tax=Gordionus sp. m RMFG-2023 TaxID=3053472 RepID=UPI0031FC91F8